MRKIIGIGETVLDIVFKDNQPIGAFPGGSVLNAMISLGRAGVETIFISEAGNDRLGEQVIQVPQWPVTHLVSIPRQRQQCGISLLQESSTRPFGFRLSRHPTR